MAQNPYPARLDGTVDDHLSRGLWLIKWLLAVPHVIILIALGLVSFVLTIVAFFSILFVARYPRGIFDFNVGVMRWGWRVSYYAFSPVATDQYPPFSLGDDTDYPARLHVDYPDELSRGLVLVKWWLLAIPQYLIVALLTNGAIVTSVDVAETGQEYVTTGGGLIGLLVIIALVALLFTGRYPGGLFDFVMGLNRWVFRVWVYAGLMRDEYPPFRLDTGGTDPGTLLFEPSETVG